VAVSDDGSHIVFYDQVSQDGSTGDIVVARVDGSDRSTLVHGASFMNGNCPPVFQFAGSSVIVASPTPPPTDGGSIDSAHPGTVAVFSGSNWTPSYLSTSARCAFSLDAQEANATVTTAAGLASYPLSGGAPTPIDANGVEGAFLPATGPDAGASVVYLDTSNRLKRVEVGPSPTPQALSTVALAAVVSLSKDGTSALVASGFDTNTYLSDLQLVPLTKPGSADPLIPTYVAYPNYAHFTSDGANAFYIANESLAFDSDAGPDAGSQTPSTLFVAPTSGGVPVRLGAPVVQDFAGADGDVFYAVASTDGPAQYDLYRLAPSAGSAPSLLLHDVDSPFFLSPQKDAVVYTWSQSAGANAGLYVTRLK
jgi:hypothetical protein